MEPVTQKEVQESLLYLLAITDYTMESCPSSLCTTLCLQWEPEVIAVALMFLAGKLSKFEVMDWNGRVPRHNAWWDMFVEDITMELLEDICHQVVLF